MTKLAWTFNKDALTTGLYSDEVDRTLAQCSMIKVSDGDCRY